MKFCGMIIVLLAVFMASVWGQQEPLTLEYASLVSHIALILFVYISDAACVCWLIGTAGSEAESPSLVPRPDSGDSERNCYWSYTRPLFSTQNTGKSVWARDEVQDYESPAETKRASLKIYWQVLNSLSLSSETSY